MEDDDRFDQAFVVIMQRLYSRVAVLTGGRHGADDLVQEVYVRLKSSAFRRRRFLEHPNPYGYALATAVNLARGQWRADRRQDLAQQPVSLSCDGGVPAVESWDRVGRLLRSLTAKEAAVVVLVDLDGYTLEEAARLLKVHKGTAHRNRLRALNKLRNRLAEPVTHDVHGRV